MRGARAKAIRRAVYGDLSTRARKYIRNSATGQVIRDAKRREYQAAKVAAHRRSTASDRVFVEAARRAARLAFRRAQAEARKQRRGREAA